MIDDRTANLNLPLPNIANSPRGEDVPRIREALSGLDALATIVDDAVSDGNLVSTAVQTLDAGQKATANDNIGSVSYASQTRTEEQKAQARANILAAVDTAEQKASTVSYSFAGFANAKTRSLVNALGAAETGPEFGLSVQLVSNGGSTDKSNNFKVAFTSVYQALPGAADGWAANLVASSAAGVASDTGLITLELNINNAHVVSTGVDGNPYTAALYITGTGTGRNDAAVIIAGSSNIYYDGIRSEDVSAPGSRIIENAFLNDQSKSRNVLLAGNTHEVGINFSTATFTNAAILAPGFSVGSTGGVTATSVNISGTFVHALSAPATLTSAGVVGEMRADANYVYICTATNTWQRVNIRGAGGSAWQSFANGATAPSVAADTNGDWQFNNGSATSVNNFTGAHDGQVIRVLFNTALTTLDHNAALILKGGVPVTPPGGGIMWFRYEAAGTRWRELPGRTF